MPELLFRKTELARRARPELHHGAYRRADVLRRRAWAVRARGEAFRDGVEPRSRPRYSLVMRALWVRREIAAPFLFRALHLARRLIKKRGAGVYALRPAKDGLRLCKPRLFVGVLSPLQGDCQCNTGYKGE